MYKVIIVDDEKQIIDGLRRMIKWTELGFEVVASARDGAEAISQIRTNRPDLVVTDIRMPEMDGLKLLELARGQFGSDIEFIILSGFSDFQYARMAMQHNVKSYILKPIDEAELYGALLDIKAVLDEKEIRKSLRIKSYINGFLMGIQPESGEALSADEERDGLRCIAVERHGHVESLTQTLEEAPPCGDLVEAISAMVGGAGMRFVLRQDRDHCNIVAGRSLLGGYGQDVRRFARSLHDFLRKTAGIQADVLVGMHVPGCRNLYESVQSLLHCRNKLFYLSKPSVVVYDDILDETFRRVYEDNGMVIRIISAFRKNDMEKVRGGFEQMVEHFKSMQVAPQIALVHLDSAMAAVLQILSERNEDISEVLELYAAYKGIQNKLGIYNLGRLAVQFSMVCHEHAMNGKRGEHCDIVAKVARYVEENYNLPLKISEIAERFFVNPAYLGQQFAKKKGCPLNHYINKVRMEKAKELLAGTNRRVYEIALETGFEDPNYFSCKFFEYTGCTPSEFRCQYDSANAKSIH